MIFGGEVREIALDQGAYGFVGGVECVAAALVCADEDAEVFGGGQPAVAEVHGVGAGVVEGFAAGPWAVADVPAEAVLGTPGGVGLDGGVDGSRE